MRLMTFLIAVSVLLIAEISAGCAHQSRLPDDEHIHWVFSEVVPGEGYMCVNMEDVQKLKERLMRAERCEK